MKKLFPLVAGALLLLLVAILLVSRGRPLHRLDERVTLRQRDKIPYGTAVARHLLPSLFPAASVQIDTRYPGTWADVDANDSNQAVVVIADYFDANSDELHRLQRFVSSGNNVFIIARAFSDEAATFFNLSFTPYSSFYNSSEDSLRVKLAPPVFAADSFFAYPGFRYEGAIQRFDSARTLVLGKNDKGWPNFVRLDKDAGHFFVHTAPLAFSNFFILHKNNIAYYQQALSVLPKNTKAVLWNEYYLDKMQRPAPDKDVNWLGALFKNPSFKRGFLTALFTLLLFVLLGMRRKQRLIPPHEKPKNDSLDFVKTLGRLYYDKQDHKNLAEKMGAYFLEHVRSRYKMTTHTLDEELVLLLQARSGYPAPELESIVATIRRLPDAYSISEEQLADFHKKLELFYQNT